jgi:hypothetical protein
MERISEGESVMNSYIRATIVVLGLATAVFLIGLLYWLFICNCARGPHGPHDPSGKPLIIFEQAVASVWDDSQTVGTQGLLKNVGDAQADDVRVTGFTLQDGSFDGPRMPPLALGDIPPGRDAVVDGVFRLSTPADGRPRLITIEGDYRQGTSPRESFRATLTVNPDTKPPGPFFGTPGEIVLQNPNAVAYPTPPRIPDEGPNAESPVFVPIGPPREVFPPTPSGTELGAVAAGAPVEIPVNTSTGTGVGTPPDPNVASSGTGVVLATFNTDIQISTDDGATFTNVGLFSADPSNPARTTFFPQSDGGLCCDQVIVYLQRQNLFVWLLQYRPITNAAGEITQSSRLRIAFATPEAVAADMWNAWTYGDLTAINRPGISTGLGINANEWLDYPDLAWSDTFLYVGVDRGWPDAAGSVYAGRRLVARLRLADMADTSSGVIRYNFAELTGSAGLNKGHFAQSAPGRMVLGSLDNSSTLRVFTWDDGSNSITNDTVGITQIQQGAAYNSPAPDGSNWVGVGFPGNISGSAFRRVFVDRDKPLREEYLFAFTAGRNAGAGRPRPYVRLQTLIPDGSGYRNFAEYDIWNNNYAFAMAALGSLNGEIGMTLGVGGGTFGVPQMAVGFRDDFIVYPVTSSTGTQMARYGDYFCTRNIPGRALFATEVYDIILNTPASATDTCATVGCTANVRYVEFGRPPPVIE